MKLSVTENAARCAHILKVDGKGENYKYYVWSYKGQTKAGYTKGSIFLRYAQDLLEGGLQVKKMGRLCESVDMFVWYHFALAHHKSLFKPIGQVVGSMRMDFQRSMEILSPC